MPEQRDKARGNSTRNKEDDCSHDVGEQRETQMLLMDETIIATRKLTNRVRIGHQSNEQTTNARHTCHQLNQNNAMGAMPRVAKTGNASHSSERRRRNLWDSS
jgi:hypothetical protein